MKYRLIAGVLMIAGFVGLCILAIKTNPTFDERARMEQELEEWQRREWINDLIEMRRQEMINRREYKTT